MRGCGGRLQCPQVSEDPGLLCVLPKRAGSSSAEAAASRRVWEGVPSGPHLGARQSRCGGACRGPHHPVQHGSPDPSKPQLAQQGTGWNLPQSAWVGILSSAVEKTQVTDVPIANEFWGEAETRVCHILCVCPNGVAASRFTLWADTQRVCVKPSISG